MSPLKYQTVQHTFHKFLMRENQCDNNIFNINIIANFGNMTFFFFYTLDLKI